MKIKNEFYFSVACLVLAYDYAWSNYELPSMIMMLLAVVCALHSTKPSSNESLHLFVRSIGILCIEAIVFLFIIQESSAWLNPFLAGGTIVFCGCWSIVYRKAKIGIRRLFDKFITFSSILAICFLILPLLLFQNNPGLQLQMMIFIVSMILPIILSLGLQLMRIKFRLVKPYQKKVNV